MGDDDEGDAGAVLDAGELELGVLAQLLVERGERLVEEQQLRRLGERAGEGDALALAAGDLVRLAAAEAAELHEVEHLADPVAALGGGHRLVAVRP